MGSMRSQTISNGAPRRGHGPVHESRRQVNVDVSEDAAAGWPLRRHGKRNSARSNTEGAAASRAEDFLDHVEEERQGTTAQMSSGPAEESSTFDALAQEVEELIRRQPQFAFLKPCRQLEKHYATRRNGGAGDSSFRHSGGTVTTEATASSKDAKEVQRAGSSAHRRDAPHNWDSMAPLGSEQLGPNHTGAKPRRESQTELEDNSTAAQCRQRDTNARPGSTTVRDLFSTEVEQEFRAPAPVYHHLNHLDATRVTSSDPSLVSVSVKCEEEPERPQSIAAAAQRALARQLSRNGIELNGFVEGRSDSLGTATVKEHEDVGLPRRSASERYSARGGGHSHRPSGETIWRISSTRCSIREKEAHIDLVAPAAARFLVETSDSPLHTPSAKHYNASPPAVAVPFKWEDAPGRAKLPSLATKPDTLQLPPRLAVRNFSREMRVSVVSHPLSGFFPCITTASRHDPSWTHHHRASKSMPLKQPHNLETTSKSGDRNARKLNKSFSQPLTSTDQSLNPKPRRMFSSELKPSHPWIMQPGYGDPTSILHSSRQSSSSHTYLSCELDASTAGSSASYESIGEDFDHDESAASPNSITNKSQSFDSQTTDAEPSFPGTHKKLPHRSEPMKGLLKLCKSHTNCLGKSKSRAYSPEVWAPTLATYFHCPEPAISSSLLEKQGAPTSSGYLNSQGEPVPINNAQSPTVSPERPTRLPYKMPSVAEQERASRNPSGRDSNSRPGAKGSMDLCPSPAYTAALEMLSPAVNLMASRRHRHGARNPPWPGSPKPHRRVQFILSICKTLKRVLFRQQPRRSVIGTRLMYHDEHAPTTFQFSKPN